MMKLICPIMTALALAGCVSIGTNYDEAAVDRLVKGMSRSDVVAVLGKPNNITRQGNGSSIALWMHSTGNALGQGRSRMLMLGFDADGKYTGIVSESQTELH
jgi:hypothetical protein